MKKQTIGIIGFGRFGQLLARLLKDDFDVCGSNRSDKSAAAKKTGVDYVPVSEAAAKDTVILAVPISAMEKALSEIRPHLKSGTLVMDTCSVKEYAIRVMKEILPPYVEILGTHPLFGPDSFAEKQSWRWVLCPAGTITLKMRKWKDYLARKGFKVVLSDPASHDKAVAFAINLPHLVGRALGRLGLKEQKITTLSFERLQTIMKVAMNDSEELFRDIHRYNRFARGIEERFLSELQRLLRKLPK